MFTDIPATAMFADEDALEAANILPVDPQRVDVYPLTPGLVSGGSGRLALKMAEDRTVTLIDTQTSRSIPVEGYTLPDMLLGISGFTTIPPGRGCWRRRVIRSRAITIPTSPCWGWRAACRWSAAAPTA